MPLNPQILGLLSQAAGGGNVNPLASILAQGGGLPPTSIAAPQQPFPVPPRGGPPASPPGLSLAPAAAQAAPQALAQAAPPAPISPTAPGGSPVGAAPPKLGINPLEALVPPTVSAQQQAPRAIAPGLGGNINPQIMQFILQALGAGGQQQQPAQSLGSILGQLR